ncbi:MAG: hypothetical protein F6J95_031350 [Leptolyngbya sp. SIO1E4]|nr:hypothetical protein [Leptolyngbya sp. SIO1E4]
MFCPYLLRTLPSNLDTIVRLWSVSSGACLNTFTDHSAWVLAVRFSPDRNYLFSSGDDETVRVWNYTPSIVKPF